MIRIFALLPGMEKIINYLASAWMLIATVIAVRQALDYHSTYRAVGVCFIGWIVQLAFFWFILNMAGGAHEPMLDH